MNEELSNTNNNETVSDIQYIRGIIDNVIEEYDEALKELAK